jgi:hypothetical protein
MNAPRLRRHPRRLALLAALTAVLLVSVGSSASQADRIVPRLNKDLTAAAHPSMAKPDVADEAFASSWPLWSSVKADTSATASAICDGCHGDAVALQILYVDKARNAEVDNVAVAWAQCQDCRATATSVQLVVVRSGRDLAANNRALSANAACEKCLSSTLALQLVVLDPDGERLSREAEQELRAWVADQAESLKSPPPPTAAARRTANTRTVASIVDLVNADLDSTTILARVARR